MAVFLGLKRRNLASLGLFSEVIRKRQILKEKNVKTMKFFFAMACVLGLAASCFAQNADTNVSTKKTSGIQAARAAAARALKAPGQSSEEVPAVAATLTSGTFVFTITIDLHPGFPTSDKIYCSANAYTSESSSANYADFSADGYVQATVSGSTATCSITLKYGWLLATPTSDTVGLGVDVRSTYGSAGTIPWWDNESTWGSSLASVPASGSTTPVKVTTAI